MPWGQARFRVVPSARPKRELAPSATTTYLARASFFSPEAWSFWRVFNTRLAPGESMRVFPLSNWTELDIWTYIYSEQIEIVPLYFARPRPVVERQGALIMVDDERMRFDPGEAPREEMVRFRTLGCYPLTGAIRSTASNLPSIIMEMQASRTSEREGRLIDNDQAASMEKKKQEGYF